MEKLEKIFLPLNTKRNKPNNKLLTIIKNSSIDLLEWLKKSFSNFVIVNNGLTNTEYDGNSTKIQLGGDVIQDTILSFDPTEHYIVFGDIDNESAFVYGNILGDGDVYLSLSNADIVYYALGDDENASDFLMQKEDSNGNVFNGLRVINNGKDYGVSNSYANGRFSSNIHYGIWNGLNSINISRFEASEYEVHGRHIIDPTGAIPNYNGFHANNTYTQLEYNKVAEDGQATGTLWVIDEDGASMFKDGTKIFRIKNSVPSHADDAAAIGGGLTTGDVYKTTSGGSTFLKIVP